MVRRMCLFFSGIVDSKKALEIRSPLKSCPTIRLRSTKCVARIVPQVSHTRLAHGERIRAKNVKAQTHVI